MLLGSSVVVSVHAVHPSRVVLCVLVACTWLLPFSRPLCVMTADESLISESEPETQVTVWSSDLTAATHLRNQVKQVLKLVDLR